MPKLFIPHQREYSQEFRKERPQNQTFEKRLRKRERKTKTIMQLDLGTSGPRDQKKLSTPHSPLSTLHSPLTQLQKILQLFLEFAV